MVRLVLVLVVFVLVASAAPASAQILNTLSGFDERDGWQGEASAFVRMSGGNTELQSHLLTAAGQWQGARHRIRLIGSYDYTRADGTTNADESVVHLRHNLRLGDHWSTLAFAQATHNEFQDLEIRELIGGGLRFDVHRDADWVLGAGASAMYEHERRTDDSRTETLRLSTFIDLQRELKEYLELLVIGWYQPDTRDFADFRASVIADLEIDLAGPLGLVLWASWERDSRPSAGVEATDWGLRTGLRVSL